MLEMEMQLDADLGIDSIKRVEILSAIQDRLPHAPAVKPEHLGTLRTLRQIAGFLEEPQQPAPVEPIPRNAARLTCLVPRAMPLAHADRRKQIRQSHPQGAVWLADDGTALTGAIRGRLQRLGHSVRVIRPSEPELPAPGETLSGLIVLAPQAVQGSSWIKDVFRLVQTAATALRRAGSLGGASFLTVSRLDGSFGLSGLLTPVDPASGALAGLAKTARAEWPEVHCKAVDLPRDLLSIEAAADQVVAEFRSDGPGEVGLSPERARTGRA